MKKFLSFLALMLLIATGPAQALVDDITGDEVISVSSTRAKESFKANTWYVMYNQGRKAYACGVAEMTTQEPQNGDIVSNSKKFLIRFIETGEEGKYYIQTADGYYYKEFANNTGTGVVETKANAGKFTITEILTGTGHWAIKGSTYYMDSNGFVVLGYGTTMPSNINGNSAWTLTEVTLTTVDNLSGGALVSYQLLKGGLFRIQNRGNTSQYIVEDPATHKGTTKALANSSLARIRQTWVIEHDDNGYSLRNANTGYYLQSDYTCKTSKYYWKIQLSPNNTSDADPYIIICHGTVKSGERNCINLNGGSSGLCNYSYDHDRNSEWKIIQVPSSEIDTATVKANFDKLSPNDGLDLDASAYYQFINLATGDMLTERISDGTLTTQEADPNAWNQYWKVTKNDDGYIIQNIYSSKYINHKATNISSVCNGYYTTTTNATNNRLWEIAPSSYAWQSAYNIVEPYKPTTGISANTTGNTYNAPITDVPSNWLLKRVNLTEEQLEEAQNSYDENEILLRTSTTILTSRLQTFFSDYACTTLRNQYMEMSDDDLRTAMSEVNLPLSMIRMALKIKNNTWGRREKEFRIYDYKAYSDPNKWNSNSLIGTGYQFTPQTGPTGISVKAGDIIILYVNSNPAPSSTLEFSSVPGCDVYSQRTAIKRGVNIFTPNTDGFLYIHHIITNVTKKLADFDPITIHIEGGRVQGYFDITRGHTNADWREMTKTIFKDEIVHMKSKYYQYNMHYNQVLQQISNSELNEIDTDGCPKGIEGTLRRWDQIVEGQHAVMGVEQFADRFNCMLSASSSSSGNPYAGAYGTYYPGVGTIMNYDALTHGTAGDNGGNFWCIAHETGHVHQGLYNMAGCTEISNNCFSQVNTWLQGSNTGRGAAWSAAQSSFHQKVFWQEYDLWQRSRAYFQLWLYFHYMQHDTTFYPRMFDKFREQPMTRSGNANNPGSGLTDYLRFAKYACEVAQADLSEFFQFWGFFVPLKDYTVGDYSNSYFTTTQDEIDQTLAFMHQYPKKLGNILFIDERIEKYPADYPGMPEGTTRVATTPGVNPGDAAVVGETGMITQFVDDVDYRHYSCNLSSTTGKVVISKASGNGAVGFKVYDADNKMQYCYNTYDFIIPEDLRSKPLYIVAALGDGTDRVIYDPNDITAVSDVLTAEEALNSAAPIFNLHGQQVSETTPGQVYIQNGRKFRVK